MLRISHTGWSICFRMYFDPWGCLTSYLCPHTFLLCLCPLLSRLPHPPPSWRIHCLLQLLDHFALLVLTAQCLVFPAGWLVTVVCMLSLVGSLARSSVIFAVWVCVLHILLSQSSAVGFGWLLYYIASTVDWFLVPVGSAQNECLSCNMVFGCKSRHGMLMSRYHPTTGEMYLIHPPSLVGDLHCLFTCKAAVSAHCHRFHSTCVGCSLLSHLCADWAGS